MNYYKNFSILPNLIFFLFIIGCNNESKNTINQIDSGNSSFNKNEIKKEKSKNKDFLSTVLDTTNAIECEDLGIEGKPSEMYRNYYRFIKKLDENALLKLSKNPIPKFRVYSMWALTEKNRKLALEQLSNFRYDSAIVNYKSGCLSMVTKVNWLVASKFDTLELEKYCPKN